MQWNDIINIAGLKHINVFPVGRPWWGLFPCKIVIMRKDPIQLQLDSESPQDVDSIPSLTTSMRKLYERSRLGRMELEFFLRDIYYYKKEIPIGRHRIEGSTMSLFLKTKNDVVITLSHILELIKDRKNRINTFSIIELHCPINDQHQDAMNTDFPTQIRASLWQKRFRYRIVADISKRHGEDTRLDSMLGAWLGWEAANEGEIGKGFFSLMRDRRKRGSRQGVISFYTNDHKLSFIMQLSYPEFYKNTVKALTFAEAANESELDLVKL